MSKLYELDQTIYELLENGFNGDCIDKETGEVMEDKAVEIFEQSIEDRKVKIESIALYIKNLAAEAEAIKAEELSLQERRKSKEGKISRLKDYLVNSMNMAGEKKFETAKTCLSFLSSVGVVITNEIAVPEIYKKVVAEIKIDKTAIKKALKSGETVDGAYLETRQNIQTK